MPGKKIKAREPIAIVGIGCNFPGGAHGPDKFWKLLESGTDAIVEVPPDRWSVPYYFDAKPGKPSKTYSKWGGFVSGINLFDPTPFGIPVREAQFMDPQQRMLLESTWEALEDAGMPIDISRPKPIGVFVGISTFDYALLQNSSAEYNSADPYSATGTSLSIAANRISYSFNFTGPSLIVDTACSSALTALDMACRAIWNGECEAAVSGGVNALLTPGTYVAFCTINMLSPDGRCKAFDKRANGFVRSEGSGIVVLKPLSAARADGNRIYAVIRGTGTNQDGRTLGMTVPNQVSQESLIRRVCEGAGINPAAIQYVEAHGTGTAVGDPIEARALGGAVGGGRSADNFCRIGSVKTNLGHLEAGSGIAGLIKTALSLHHGVIPPSLHFETPNPNIDFEALRLRVVTKAEPYIDGPRLAGLNSFGFGGANAHAVLEAVEDALGTDRKTPGRRSNLSESPKGTDDTPRPELLVLSARDEPALKMQAESWSDYLRATTDPLPDICHAAATQRTAFETRLAVVAHSTEEMADLLSAYSKGENSPFVTFGHLPENAEVPRVVFVYSGQGPQWWAMGRELFHQEPVFRQAIEECGEALGKIATWDLSRELLADEASSRMAETEIAQPAITAVQIALTALWASWGVVPSAVVGHSVGEVAAAHAAGVYTLPEAMRVIYHRGRCMEQTPLRGKMIAVGITPEETLRVIRDYGERLSLAAVNSPNSVSISGDAEAVEEIAVQLEKLGHLVRNVPVNYAFHSAHMNPVRGELLSALKGLRPRRARLLFYSTVTGDLVFGKEMTSDYWWRNVRDAVQFAPALNKLAVAGFDTYLELAAHPVLSNSVRECLAPIRPGVILSSLRRHASERATMLVALGSLYTRGISPDWSAALLCGPVRVSLPTYRWKKESFWAEPPVARENRIGPSLHPLLMLRQRHPDRSWLGELDRRLHPWLSDHRVQGHMVFPAAGYMEMAVSSAMQLSGSNSIQLEDVEFTKPLFIPASGDVPEIRITHSSLEPSFRIHSRIGDITNEWSAHSSGKQRPLTRQAPAPREGIEAIRARCGQTTTAKGFYEQMASCGLVYGPLFQAVKQVWHRHGEALAEIVLPEKLEPENHKYAFHPSILDACVQITTCTHSDETKATEIVLRLPVFLERFFYYRSPGTRLWMHAWMVRNSASAAVYDAVVYDEQGEVTIEFKGMKAQVVQGNRASTQGSIGNLFYEQEWQLAPLAGHVSKSQPSLFFPPTTELAAKLRRLAQQEVSELGLEARYAEVKPRIEELCAALFGKVLGELGWNSDNEKASPDAMARVGIAPEMTPAFERLLARWAGFEGARRPASTAEIERMWRDIVHAFPALLPDLILLDRCALSLADILRGKTQADSVLAPDGSLNQLENFHAQSFRFRTAHGLIRDCVGEIAGDAPEGRCLRILEVGAGTGGLTGEILPALRGSLAEYYFTDKSSDFFNRAEQKLRDFPFVKYEEFDSDGAPDSEKFAAETFDLIVAGHALHGAASLEDSLAHLQRLLAPGGLLILEEAAADSWLDDLTLGLNDGVRSSRLDTESWSSALTAAGFARVETIEVGKSESRQIVLLAKAPHSTAPPPSAAKERRGAWLLLEDAHGWARKIGEELKNRGQECVYARAGKTFAKTKAGEFELNPGEPKDMTRVLAELPKLKGILHLWSLDTNGDDSRLIDTDLARAEDLTCHSTLHLVKALESRPAQEMPQLWLVTTGAQPVGKFPQPLHVAQAPLIGLGRNISNELPDLRSRLVDLSRAPQPEEVIAVVDELFADDEDAEEEIALRGEARYRSRLVSRFDHGERRPLEFVEAKETPCRLDAIRPGAIDGISFVPLARRAPGPDEVEIEVVAAGLNFRDVMKSLGIYPSDVGDAMLLGDECSGRIVSVGEGVTKFKVGDEVMTMGAGCFAPFVTQKAAVVMSKPAGFSFEEAATVLTTYTTAHYALSYLGRMRAGEKVLVHAAAGGVGIAAVQLALASGATVYATAGSPEKRRFLHLLGVEHVSDSRSLDFADEILAATGGKGVDLVLNSLAGEAISKSLAVLAPGGRFLEIGKKDIYQNMPIGLRPFRNNLSYFAIDLGRALEPEMIETFLAELKKLFETPGIRPLPHRVFPASEAKEAFRHMTQARQIGKIVLSFREARVPITEVTPPISMRFKLDATYLIVGGVGGFGLATAQWLVENGARFLVLASRSAAPTPEASDIIAKLEAAGVKVVLAKCDAAKKEDLASLLEKIGQDLPPLKGVFHSAMVLDDGLLVQMTAERFQKVMTPKVQGAWNLHCLTHDLPLDIFVLYSSSSSTIGNPGQANYCAANAFLDALSHLRRNLKLPSLTVNWGLLGEVGVITRDAKLAEHFRRLGFEGLPTRTALNGLGVLLMEHATQTTVWDIDWSRWIEAPAHYARSKRYSLLTTIDALKQNQRGEGERLRAALDAASATERVALAQNCLRMQVAEVLRIPASKIETERPLNEQGMDSLMAVELMHRLDSNLGISLSPTKLIGKPTIVKLAVSVLEALGKSPNAETVTQAAVADVAEDASASIDFRREVRLPDHFPAGRAPFNKRQCENPRRIILTGPSEYLGLYLLHDLVQTTAAQVICFVTQDGDAGAQRDELLQMMKARNLALKDLSRIEMKRVDFTAPRLGLNAEEFDRLAVETDFIVHNYAEVNHIASYDKLKGNVSGTLEVIRLAAQHHLKPVHYISSITVFGASNAEGDVGHEDDPLDAPEKLFSGYDAGRWVSEQCLRLAQAQGVPTVIYRPGLLWGDSRNFVSTPNDLVWRLVLSCLALGRGPTGDFNLFLTPVDFASRAICTLARKPENFGRTFHVVSPHRNRLEDVLRHACKAGYPVKLITWKEWLAALQGETASKAISQILPYFMFRGTLWENTVESMNTGMLDSTHFQHALAGTGVSCQPMNQDLVETYLRDLVRQECLAKP